MFKMADAELRGRRALIVEGEAAIARQMVDDVRRSGGQAVDVLLNVDDALSFVQNNPPPDCLIVDVRQADAWGRPLASVFADYGVAVIFVTGFDDWYLDDEMDEPFYAVTSFAHG